MYIFRKSKLFSSSFKEIILSLPIPYLNIDIITSSNFA